MTDELTITKFVFDHWWTGTYVDHLTPLLPQEIEALVDFHWRELQATAIRHSLREQAKEDEEDSVPISVVCDTHVGGHDDDPIEGCTCGTTTPFHIYNCPVFQTQNLTKSTE